MCTDQATSEYEWQKGREYPLISKYSPVFPEKKHDCHPLSLFFFSSFRSSMFTSSHYSCSCPYRYPKFIRDNKEIFKIYSRYILGISSKLALFYHGLLFTLCISSPYLFIFLFLSSIQVLHPHHPSFSAPPIPSPRLISLLLRCFFRNQMRRVPWSLSPLGLPLSLPLITLPPFLFTSTFYSTSTIFGFTPRDYSISQAPGPWFWHLKSEAACNTLLISRLFRLFPLLSPLIPSSFLLWSRFEGSSVIVISYLSSTWYSVLLYPNTATHYACLD